MAKARGRRRSVGRLVGACGALVLLGHGCNAMLDIEHIEFGEPDAGGGAGPGGAGPGGSSAGGGNGASGLTPTGGVAGASTGTGTGTVGPENCTNGEDDNGDQLVDCEDPLCTDYRCVAEAPLGWSGPLALYIGSDTNVTCGGAWSTQAFSSGYGSLNAPAASCSGCNCGSPNGASCNIAPVDLFWLTNCSSSSYDQTQAVGQPNVCYLVNDADIIWWSARGQLSTASGGSCSPSGGDPTVQPTSYAQRALGCDGAPAGEGCTAGLCVPIPEPPLSTPLCIAHSGDTNCPTGSYTQKYLSYQSVADTRDCTDCGCGSPQGMSCGSLTYFYVDYNNSNCWGSPVVAPHDGSTCVNLNMYDGPGSMEFIPGSPSGGYCSSSGGQPTGSATPAEPLTICCTP